MNYNDILKAKAETPEGKIFPTKARYHRIDGWRGYPIPRFAVLGANDTGMAYDSPCPSDSVKAEIPRFRNEALKPLKIRSRVVWGETSNVFCGIRWVVVNSTDFAKAAQATVDWNDATREQTKYVYTADLEKLGYTPSKTQQNYDSALNAYRGNL